MAKQRSSVAITKVLEGNYYDRILSHIRFAEKNPLAPEDEEIFKRIERAKEIWLDKKDDRFVVSLLKQEFGVKDSQAYNYLADAKAIYSLFISFNYMAELLIEKERLEKLIRKAEEETKSPFAPIIAKLIEQKIEVLQRISEEQTRMKSDDRKTFVFIYNSDPLTLPGMTQELLDEMNREFDQMELRARSKFKNIGEDVEYQEL